MKTHAIVDAFDEGEIECRKHCNDIGLDGVKVLGMNLIDEHQVYLFIKEEDGSITSTVVHIDGFISMVNSLIDELNK